MDLTPCAVVLARSRTSSAPIQRVAHRSFRDDQHAVRHEYAFLVPGSFETTCHQYGQARTGDQLEPNSTGRSIPSVMGRKDAEPDALPHLQILCRVARASDAGDRGGGLAPQFKSWALWVFWS